MDALTPQMSQSSSSSNNDIERVKPVLDGYIEWFRLASPYIDSHRNKTFVISFSDDVLASGQFSTLMQDIALLNTLGVRLVVVYGLRKQIDQRLESATDTPQFCQGLRITTDAALHSVIAETGRARILIESALSTGVVHSQRTGARVTIASGNFVSAQPVGVIDGVDHLHTGVVRQIHHNAIERQLQNNCIVLLSPLGYSRTGEMFNLEAHDIATRAATALSAEKLIFLTSLQITHPDQSLVRESTPKALTELLQTSSLSHATKRLAEKTIEACNGGVNRVHILKDDDPNALLKELFTRDGFGTMINADNYETLRSASIFDVGGIIELIRPLEDDGTLIRRSREKLELEIDQFVVIERDGLVISCAALLIDKSTQDTSTRLKSAEIACLVTHPDYRNGGRAEALLSHLENLARKREVNVLYVLTTRTNHWFIEQGFQAATLDDLPATKRSNVNALRNSKVLIKKLQPGPVTAQHR